MMSDAEIDKIFNNFKDWFKQFVDQRIEKKLEPYRDLILNEFTSETQISTLVDALAVAELMGFDLSTPANKRHAKQKVYYLARTKAIPSVRISQRRLKFDLEKVKQKLATGGVAILPTSASLPGTNASL